MQDVKELRKLINQDLKNELGHDSQRRPVLWLCIFCQAQLAEVLG